jgi:hypothetical protein
MPCSRFSGSLVLAAVAVLLSGCGSMRSYDGELKQTVGMVKSGSVTAALQDLENNNSGKEENKDLLYFFEKGELLRLTTEYDNSNQAWMRADAKVHEWEETAKTSPEKLFGNVGSFILNDRTRRYDGFDYEKVLLTSRIALNHIGNGDWDKARTEIKKTHEREAIIAQVREKQIDEAKAEAEKKNVKTTYKELKGYPVETFDDPEVTKLVNGYQNAFTHYLAGFTYEALGEKSLAAPGYRKAMELRPDLPRLGSALEKLDNQKQRPGYTDVLFVVEAGTAPARESMQIPVPVPLGQRIGVVSISFPVIHSDKSSAAPGQLMLDGKDTISLDSITNIDAMARRSLKDEMPGIIGRNIVRAIAKGVMQKEAGDRGGLIGSLLATAFTVATEQADERSWRTLPALISIGRAQIPSGKHQMTLAGAQGTKVLDFTVSGSHAVVPVRLMSGSTYLMQSKAPAQEASSTIVANAEPITVPTSASVNPSEVASASVAKKASIQSETAVVSKKRKK